MLFRPHPSYFTLSTILSTMSIRTEKVASEIRQALSRPLADLASEISAGLITVTHVRMSPDLRIARVYLSVFGGKLSPEQALAKVSDRAKDIRYKVTGKVRLRFSPELHFYLDDTLETIERIDTLLKRIPPSNSSEPSAE
ncbi:MAG: 30S ribosome-binding factor RbfA [Candidatus Kapaibacterium sp.]|nr:MAG: 30S ribosome-binding factor RbfA [Candidatus Kapabacteria bacterium]